MTTFAVQYLENPPADISLTEIRQRLRDAFSRLPISLVLLGWDLPERIEDIVAEETTRYDAQLFRWQPLLCSDTSALLPPQWVTIGLDGNPVAGHGGMSSFTFMCPNRPGVSEFIEERLESALSRGIYQGFFFDRMRFPSPTVDPSAHLACFCNGCARLAADSGLDLKTVRRQIESLLADASGAKVLTRSLFGKSGDPTLDTFFEFRKHSITRVVESAAKFAHSNGLGVGLDCFSPALAHMVGQDIPALDHASDWIKIMTYPRVFGPAGLPFELCALINWLSARYYMTESEAIKFISEHSGLDLPLSQKKLSTVGLGSEVIATETERGRKAGITRLLTGVALVEMQGVHESTRSQLRTDLETCRRAGADGLVLSWDLWYIQPEYLTMIHELWEE
jgi:hypothetical protein